MHVVSLGFDGGFFYFVLFFVINKMLRLREPIFVNYRLFLFSLQKAVEKIIAVGWDIFQPFLFGLIGAEISVMSLRPETVGKTSYFAQCPFCHKMLFQTAMVTIIP